MGAMSMYKIGILLFATSINVDNLIPQRKGRAWPPHPAN